MEGQMKAYQSRTSPCRFQGSNSGHQVWQQVPLPTKPSDQCMNILSNVNRNAEIQNQAVALSYSKWQKRRGSLFNLQECQPLVQDPSTIYIRSTSSWLICMCTKVCLHALLFLVEHNAVQATLRRLLVLLNNILFSVITVQTADIVCQYSTFAKPSIKLTEETNTANDFRSITGKIIC